MDFPELDFTFDGVKAADIGLAAAKDVNLHPASPNVTWATPDYGEPVDTSRFVTGHMTYGLVDDEYATFWVLAEDFEGRQAAWRWLVANVHGGDVAMTCSLLTADDGRALEWYGACSVEDVSADPGTLEKVKVSWQRRPYRMMPDGEAAVEFDAAWGIDVAAATFVATDGRAVTSAAPMRGELWLTCPDGTLWSTGDGRALVQQAAEPMAEGVRIAADGALAVLWSESGAWWSRDMARWRAVEAAPTPLLSVHVEGGAAAFEGEGAALVTRDFSHWADATAISALDGVTAACSHGGAYVLACEDGEGSLMLATRDAMRSFASSSLPVRVSSMCSVGRGVVAVGDGRSFFTADLANWAEGAAVGDAAEVVPFGDRAVVVGSGWAVSGAASDCAEARLPIVRGVVLPIDTSMPTEVTVECNYEASVSLGGRAAPVPAGTSALPWALGHGRHELTLSVPYQPDVWAPMDAPGPRFPAGTWWRLRAVGERPDGWDDFAPPPEGRDWTVLQNGSLVAAADLVALPPWGSFPVFEPAGAYLEVPDVDVSFAAGVFFEKQGRVRATFRWERGEL